MNSLRVYGDYWSFVSLTLSWASFEIDAMLLELSIYPILIKSDWKSSFSTIFWFCLINLLTSRSLWCSHLWEFFFFIFLIPFLIIFSWSRCYWVLFSNPLCFFSISYLVTISQFKILLNIWVKIQIIVSEIIVDFNLLN